MPRQSEDNRIRLSLDARQRLGHELIEKIRSARSGMADMLDKLKDWDALYEGKLPEKAVPWPGCSNICVPLTQWVCDTYKARIADVILSVLPLVLVEPPAGLQQPEYKKRAQGVESFLQSYCERMKLGDILADDVLSSALRSPVAATKIAWRDEMRQTQRFMPTVDPMTGEPMLGEDGQGVFEPQEVQESRYRGPRVEFVDIRNLVIWPLTAKSVEECQIVGDRFSLTKQQDKERVKLGKFDRVALNLEAESEEGSEAAAEFDELDEYMGIERLGDYEQLDFWEVIAAYDADGDGFAEDCVFTIHDETGGIVRAIRYPYYHGLRYYDFCVLFPRAGRAFGRTMPQILEGSQRELNAIHNQRIDAVTLAMSKPFVGRRSSTVDYDTLLIAPGYVTLLDDLNDVKELAIDPQIPGMDVEQMARDYAERASGIFDQTTGKESEEKKTATEVGLVASSAGIRFADTIRAVHQSIINIARQVAGLCYQYAGDEELQAYQIERDDLIFPWRYVAHGNTGTANKTQQRQESMLLYDKLIQSPLVAQDLTRIWRLSQDLLQAFDRTDTEAYVGSEDEARQLMAQIQAQQQAVRRRGHPPQHGEQRDVGRKEGQPVARRGGPAEGGQQARERQESEPHRVAVGKRPRLAAGREVRAPGIRRHAALEERRVPVRHRRRQEETEQRELQGQPPEEERLAVEGRHTRQRSGNFVHTASGAMRRSASSARRAGISPAPVRCCSSGDTRQSLNPALRSCSASAACSANRVNTSTQTQSTIPASASAVSTDSYSETRTAQRRSPRRAVFTRNGSDWSRKKKSEMPRSAITPSRRSSSPSSFTLRISVPCR